MAITAELRQNETRTEFSEPELTGTQQATVVPDSEAELLDSSERLLSQIEVGVTSRHDRSCAAFAQRLRFLCRELGAEEVASAAAAVEKLCRGRRFGEAADLLPHLEVQVSQLEHALRREARRDGRLKK